MRHHTAPETRVNELETVAFGGAKRPAEGRDRRAGGLNVGGLYADCVDGRPPSQPLACRTDRSVDP